MPTTVTPYLCVHDATAALAFYAQALGAKELDRIVMEDGRVGHASIEVDGAVLYLSDEFPEMGVRSPKSIGDTSVMLHVDVPDVDAAFDRAVAAGATALRPPEDQPELKFRNAVVLDPFGHRWMFFAQ